MSRTLDLTTATPEDVVRAILEVEETRPGFAYDAGVAIIKVNPTKEFPGPSPYDSDRAPTILIRSFDASRREEVEQALRDAFGWHRPVFDPADPKWLKAVRAERRRAEREAAVWRDPLDTVLPFISAASSEESDIDRVFSVDADGYGILSATEANAIVERLRAAGMTAETRGFNAPSLTHRRSLSDYFTATAT